MVYNIMTQHWNLTQRFCRKGTIPATKLKFNLSSSLTFCRIKASANCISGCRQICKYNRGRSIGKIHWNGRKISQCFNYIIWRQLNSKMLLSIVLLWLHWRIVLQLTNFFLYRSRPFHVPECGTWRPWFCCPRYLLWKVVTMYELV